MTCPALSMHLEAIADDTFTIEGEYEVTDETTRDHEVSTRVFGAKIPEVTSIPRLSSGFLAYRLRYRKLYETWFNAIYDEMLKRMQDGENIPGWKITKGRRSFSWVSEEKAVAVLEDQGLDEDDIKPRSIVSVAEARKLLKAMKMKPAEIEKILSPKVVQTAHTAPSLVTTDDDDREDYQDAVDEIFTVSDGSDDL
jgi:hypothetical protein